MGYTLNQADLDALLQGGAFFGSGGGGTVTSARNLSKYFKQGDYYPVDHFEVVSVEEATDGDTVMVAYMGAPEAIDSTQYPIGPVAAAQQVIDRLKSQDRKLAYVISPESGALGFLVAGLVAAKLGLKVIDADGAGRAVPSLPMLTYAAAEISPRPTFLVSQGDLCVELNVTPRKDSSEGGKTHQQDVSTIVEQMLRPILAEQEFNEFGGLAMWVMTSADLPKALPIRGTLSRALQFGRALIAGELATSSDVIHYLKKHCHIDAYAITPPATLASAKVDTTGGFDLGKIQLQHGHDRYTVLYQNESLMAWNSALPHPIAVAPDSIAYFVEGKGQAVYSNGDLVLDNGQLNPTVKDRKIVLLAWQADRALTHGLILDSFMTLLASIGYLGPYVPLAKLDDLNQSHHAPSRVTSGTGVSA